MDLWKLTNKKPPLIPATPKIVPIPKDKPDNPYRNHDNLIGTIFFKHDTESLITTNHDIYDCTGKAIEKKGLSIDLTT